MSLATTKIAKHAQSTWNDGRRKNFIALCIDTETCWSVNGPPTSRLALGAWQIRRRRQKEWEDCGIMNPVSDSFQVSPRQTIMITPISAETRASAMKPTTTGAL